jgi:hypothetical protein
MDNRKYRLNQAKSINSVNEDTKDKVFLKSNSNILPVGNINKIVNAGEQFNKERKNSSTYRITGNINPIFTNVLFNSTGDNSWKTFNTNEFRDRTFPANGLSIDDEEDYTFTESIDFHLKSDGGWYGYKNPDQTLGGLCTWIDMEPNRTLFNLSGPNKNWELIITYPFDSESDKYNATSITSQGLLLMNATSVTINDRAMTTFTTPVKHGLLQGESVRLSGIGSNNGTYSVVRLGLANGDDKEYYFSVEISDNIILTSNSKMARIYNGVKSEYYFRKFKKIKVKSTQLEMESDDYEIFPLAFAKTIYKDSVNHYVINEDIDISGLVDNLNRPLSEIYVTLIKTDSGGVFSNTMAGIDIPLLGGTDSNRGIPDIRRLTNDTSSNIALTNNVSIDDNIFYGDVAEYNTAELKEKILGDVNHRFNTYNRENGGDIAANSDFNNAPQIDLGSRQEGYIYKPHHLIKIREFSSYIEQGVASTIDMPDYKVNMGDGRYLWRDLLDIGFNDIKEEFLDYPFLNGNHYINFNISLPLKRQDPFGYYGLQHTPTPSDIQGDEIDDNKIIKRSQDVC